MFRKCSLLDIQNKLEKIIANTTFKDQLEKQTIISKVKNLNFNNVSFRNLLDDDSMKVFSKIRDQDEVIDYSSLNFIG